MKKAKVYCPKCGKKLSASQKKQGDGAILCANPKCGAAFSLEEAVARETALHLYQAEYGALRAKRLTSASEGGRKKLGFALLFLFTVLNILLFAHYAAMEADKASPLANYVPAQADALFQSITADTRLIISDLFQASLSPLAFEQLMAFSHTMYICSLLGLVTVLACMLFSRYAARTAAGLTLFVLAECTVIHYVLVLRPLFEILQPHFIAESFLLFLLRHFWPVVAAVLIIGVIRVASTLLCKSADRFLLKYYSRTETRLSKTEKITAAKTVRTRGTLPPGRKTLRDFFIIYCAADRDKAYMLATDIESKGFSCVFADRDLRRNDDDPLSTYKKIMKVCRAAVIVTSEQAMQRDFSSEQVDACLRMGLPAIAVKTEGCAFTGVYQECLESAPCFQLHETSEKRFTKVLQAAADGKSIKTKAREKRRTDATAPLSPGYYAFGKRWLAFLFLLNIAAVALFAFYEFNSFALLREQFPSAQRLWDLLADWCGRLSAALGQTFSMTAITAAALGIGCAILAAPFARRAVRNACGLFFATTFVSSIVLLYLCAAQLPEGSGVLVLNLPCIGAACLLLVSFIIMHRHTH